MGPGKNIVHRIFTRLFAKLIFAKPFARNSCDFDYSNRQSDKQRWPMNDVQIAPRRIDERVRRFCASIASDSAPSFVSVRVAEGARPLMCFVDIESIVRKKGGRCVLGWDITEIRHIALEAEAHAVWQRPDGVLESISPPAFDIDRILFLPDSRLEYTGARIPVRRFSLGPVDKVDQYFFLMDASLSAPKHIARNFIMSARQIRHELQE